MDVPEPHTNAQVLRLSFSKKDQLSQNPALQKALDGVKEFRLKISPDGRFLLLDPEGPYNMTFTPQGVQTHHPLGELLQKQGLELPVSFRVNWIDPLHCWVAQYNVLFTRGSTFYGNGLRADDICGCAVKLP